MAAGDCVGGRCLRGGWRWVATKVAPTGGADWGCLLVSAVVRAERIAVLPLEAWFTAAFWHGGVIAPRRGWRCGGLSVRRGPALPEAGLRLIDWELIRYSAPKRLPR